MRFSEISVITGTSSAPNLLQILASLLYSLRFAKLRNAPAGFKNVLEPLIAEVERQRYPEMPLKELSTRQKARPHLPTHQELQGIALLTRAQLPKIQQD